jgi:speckle-type POZ protein
MGWGFEVFFRLRLSGCLNDDRLKIRCELTVFFPAPRTTEDTTARPGGLPLGLSCPATWSACSGKARARTSRSMWRARGFRAHRVLFAAWSPVFDAALFGRGARHGGRGHAWSRWYFLIKGIPMLY